METFSGAIGGFSGVLLSHPFDTLRVRIQSLEAKPKIITFIQQILKKEGFWVLYRGIIPPLFGMGIEKATVFTAYNYAKSKTDNIFISGYFAGLTSSLIITPIEKIKIHLQTTKVGIFNSIITTIKNRSLYQGFSPTFFRESVGFGIYFSFYNLYKADSPFHYFLGGALSGSLAWCFIYPIDTVKTNAQIQKINILEFIRKHTLREMYRGFPLALMRAFPLHGGVFLGYEMSKIFFHRNGIYKDETVI